MMSAPLTPPASAIRAHEELFAWWNSLKPAGGLPPRHRLHPADLKRHLPTVSLTEFRSGEDYRVRLAGTGLYGVYGGEITGRTFGEVYNSTAADYWRGELDRVVRERRPGVGAHSLAWRGASHLSLIWLRLPLANDAGEVSVILGYDAVVGLASLQSGIRPAA
jgi:hypothetical protein